ncbi:hypothetical protein [Haloferula rosea]|uniref:Uncharacterized protein n=1 Tax=Haloferula rosea TaxID=490093 RepID=A0A934RFZ5_9BACT|nr:hypothetical protein [Haloferula rosea]MBK1828474.1 hypothetical protein [Haloferula rosea]
MPIHRKLTTLALLLGFTLLTRATPERGTWFWGNTTVPTGSSPHGSSVVVGDSAKEDAEIAFMTAWGVTRVYGSYGTGPGINAERAKYREWNAKLHAAGIESQLLLSEFDPGDPSTELTNPVSLLNKIQARLIDFNDVATLPEEKFDALHLDVEPQTLNAWKDSGGGTPAIRRAFLDDLLQLYLDVRALLDGAGYASLPIYADIPWNWGKFPSTTAGWVDEPDRNAWYASVNAVLDGVSLMTFTTSKDTFAEIDDATEFERETAFVGKCRVAIQAHVGPGEIWPNWPTFMNILSELEDPVDGYDTTGATDIENYAFWRYSHTTFGPILTTSGLTFTADPAVADGGIISFPATPGYLYTIRHSSTLTDPWLPIATRRTSTDAERELIEFPVEMTPPRGFYQVSEDPDPAPAPE